MTDYDDLFAETAPDGSVFAEKRALTRYGRLKRFEAATNTNTRSPNSSMA
ncbi:hypothetical protein [Halosegnis marinus]